jgi:hypothetical protein
MGFAVDERGGRGDRQQCREDECDEAKQGPGHCGILVAGTWGRKFDALVA